MKESHPEIKQYPPSVRLNRLNEAIRKDPHIFHAGTLSQYFPHSWTEIIDIVLSPIVPVFDPDKLNQIISKFASNLRPTCKQPFRYDEDGLHLGHLLYQESIGTITTETTTHITAHDHKLFHKLGIREGKTHTADTRGIGRRINLRLYPTMTLASSIFNLEYQIINKQAPSCPQLEHLKRIITPQEFIQIVANPDFIPLSF